MTERRRWDTDDRYVGVADARVAAPDLERLLAQTAEPGWVTEDALAHLGERCRAAAEVLDLEIVRIEAVDDVLEVDVRTKAERERHARFVAGFALVGAFAESSTHVRERVDEDSALELTVVTGMLPGDGEFATHGHLARIRILGPY
jgi:hypothetical protein